MANIINTPESSILNATQASNVIKSDFQNFGNPGDDLTGLMKNENLGPKKVNKFNIATIIAAALIFIVVIAWFEVVRLFLVYVFEDKRDVLFKNAMANLVYAIIATVISIFLVFLLKKYWLNK